MEGGECQRQKTFWPPNICTRSFVRPFALSKLHARSLDYSRFAAVVGRGRGPHALDRQFERGGFRGGSASFYPKPRGRCLALEFGAYILGLIGHGIRANKHRSRSGIGMHAVSNGSELHSDFK